MTNVINNTDIRRTNTPGTIAFVLALVSVAIWTFVGIEFFIIRDQMMNTIVLLIAVIGLIPLIASFVFAIVGLCRKNAKKRLGKSSADHGYRPASGRCPARTRYHAYRPRDDHRSSLIRLIQKRTSRARLIPARFFFFTGSNFHTITFITESCGIKK